MLFDLEITWIGSAMKVCETPHCVYGGERKREARERKRPERYRARKRTETDREKEPEVLRHVLLRILEKETTEEAVTF